MKILTLLLSCLFLVALGSSPPEKPKQEPRLLLTAPDAEGASNSQSKSLIPVARKNRPPLREILRELGKIGSAAFFSVGSVYLILVAMEHYGFLPQEPKRAQPSRRKSNLKQ